MKTIISSAALYDLTANHPDPAFRSLLSRLLAAISCDGEFDPGELLKLVIIDPGDTLDAVNAALDFTLTPDWEACDQEGDWMALTYVLSDWGEGLLVCIPDQLDIEPAFLRLVSEMPETP
jgi:hypothetical protein